MDFKKALNLNTYEWWRNHRRIVTFGGFLIIFGWWIDPVIQESRYNNICVRTHAEIILSDELPKKIKSNLQNLAPAVNKRTYAEAIAHKVCNERVYSLANE